MNKQIFSIWVKDRKGVLSNIAKVFGETDLNIHSLAVGVSETSDVSRITIVANGNDDSVSTLLSKINSLPDTVRIKRITNDSSVMRELALIMVDAPDNRRQDVISIADIFRAQVVDTGLRTMTLEISGGQDKIEAMQDLLRPFGIREIVRTGLIAIDRGIRT